jgi:hypothetical protein
MTTVGLISDTHGPLRPEALRALRGSDLVIHAGDIGDAEVIVQLRALAPVFAVRGNTDHAPWALRIPTAEVVEAAGLLFYVLHDLADLDLDPLTGGFAAVVSGHSHQPSIQRRGGVLYINPGSAGPRRFKLPITVARVRIADGQMEPEIVQLEV